MTKKWYRVLATDELKENRTMSVSCGKLNICMTKFKGKYGAMDNHCPHQGGPLGEGSIENGWLRCPWHGWEFHPITGLSPGAHEDGVPTFEVEERKDGIYIALNEEEAHVRTVSDIMTETMVNWGIRQVFGMVGHSNLGLADAIRRQCNQGKMTYYGIRHEGCAAFAASAYGKLTGRPAACLAIAGPGSTNLLTGLWDAHVDRAPVLALSGQVETQFLGPGAFQEIDLQDAFGNLADFSQQVLPDSKHTELVNLACKSAILNRSVSHLIFPDQVQTHPADDSGGGAKAGGPEGRLGNRAITPASESLQAAVKMLKEAKKPIVICGHGARFEMPHIMALAEHLKMPVLTTFKGKGIIDDAHPLACGVLGRSGTPIASYFMNECDVILVFGASFSNHTGITTKKKLIQVDYDLMNLGKFHSVDVPVWGEIGETSKMLLTALKRVKKIDRKQEIARRWKLWRAEKAKRKRDDKGRGINSCLIFEELGKQAPDDAILAVDVGNNTYSFGRYFESKENQAVLMSGYLGSIGFSLPAAIGAWSATQEEDEKFAGRKVISISGDGGLGQYLAEVTTAVKYKMNITHILLHNKELGKITKEQKIGGFDVWQTGLHNPNFADFVESCGGMGIRVDNPKDLASAMRKALKSKQFSLVEIVADAELV